MGKKFLFVIDNLSTGGAQRQMVNLAVGLRQRGYSVEIFCYAPGDLLAGPLKEEGIPVHWHLKRSRYAYDTVLELRRLLLHGKFDLGLSFLTTPNFYLIAASLSLLHPIPIVVSERFCNLPDQVPTSERVVYPLYRFADHVVTNSHHQRLSLSDRFPGLKKRISTVYNGYDLQVYTPAPKEPDNHPIKILVIASVSRYKNGLCLIEALRILKEKYGLRPEVDWIGQRVMAGDRLVYLQEMEYQIRSAQIDPQWHWLDQRMDIVQQLHQHDVLVHPSYGEGLPNVVCEALACARPVIVSNVLDHANLVQHNQSGFLFNHQDPADLADKIWTLNDLSVERKREIGQCGRRFAEENLSLDRFIHDYEQLFLGLLNK